MKIEFNIPCRQKRPPPEFGIDPHPHRMDVLRVSHAFWRLLTNWMGWFKQAR
jgi:hypothetical protein